MNFPRFVHREGGSMLKVSSVDGYEAALADGWAPLPVPMPILKGDERTNVYTADELAVALKQGWARVVAAPVPQLKRGRS